MTLFDELRPISILDGFTDSQVADMAASGTEETYAAGDRLFDEGRPGRGLVGPAVRSDRPGPADRQRGSGHGDHGERRPVGGRLPRVGRQRRLHGLRAGDGGDPRLPAAGVGAGSLRRDLVPLRRAPAARPDRHGPAHRERRPPARGPRRARHARRRSRARDQQPRLRRRALGRRAAAVERRRLRLAAAAGGSRDPRRAVRRARRAAPLDRPVVRADGSRAVRPRGVAHGLA